MSQPIPQPPAIPFIGNITNIDSELPLRSFQLLAKQYGEIYQLNFLGRQVIFVNSQKLVAEVCDEKRFKKNIAGGLDEVRNLVGDALFTARFEEPNWAIAHRILMPAFGPANVRNMFDDMQDIVSQLVLKWERFGPTHPIDPVEDFTRIAFDAIALCAMNYRINSFYKDDMPPFITAMGDFLVESALRAKRPRLVQAVMTGSQAKYEADMKIMRDLTEQVIEDRKRRPIEKKDLLNLMLHGKDSVTGQGLSDDNIKKQLMTFFIAGHETSSGMLSFTMYHLLKNPHAYQRLQAEVDQVLQGETPRLEHLGKLEYLNAVMRESLRLSSPIVQHSVAAVEDTTIGNGRFAVKKGQSVVIATTEVHRDTKVWGDNVSVDEFLPERMLDGKFEALPPKAWEPFGNGSRACIGRPFAWQEVLLVLATIFQRFDFHLVDPGYILHLKQTMTVKPKDFQFYATLRSSAPKLVIQGSNVASVRGVKDQNSGRSEGGDEGGQKMYVLYGSNTGSSEAFAQRLASEAPAKGFSPKLGTLDSVVGFKPTDGPVVIVTASFEGEPADNAAHFVEDLKSHQGNSSIFKDVKYAVFGCGNREWVGTYQRIPKLIDGLGTSLGATRLLERGEADAASSTFFEAFDEWESKLWEVLSKMYKVKADESAVAGYNIQVLGTGTERASRLRQSDVAIGTVIQNRVLTKGEDVKRHIEFELPENSTYRAGDYLAVLPINPPSVVQKVMARMKIPAEQEIQISSNAPTTLPTDNPVKVQDILSGYIELSQPATKKNLEALLSVAKTDISRAYLNGLIAGYPKEVLEKRVSVVDVLVKETELDVPLALLLSLLPSMRVRQYSISSSPLWNATHVTLTVGVLDAPSLSNTEDIFLGVASNFLSSLKSGDKVQMAIRPSAAAFHPPDEPTTPMIMFASGSGIAPFRGFIQERALQKAAGREIGRNLLFFGCRRDDEDFLYHSEELKEWVKQGVVEVRPAFSREAEKSEGCKYVQDRVWHDRADIDALYQAGAKLFTCGSARAAAGIKDACVRMLEEFTKCDREEALKKFERIQRERYATDVFG